MYQIFNIKQITLNQFSPEKETFLEDLKLKYCLQLILQKEIHLYFFYGSYCHSKVVYKIKNEQTGKKERNLKFLLVIIGT